CFRPWPARRSPKTTSRRRKRIPAWPN
ncbi:type VI secretion system contractile sheath small subunit, partial [Pseudomonas aeruginosa]